MSNIHEFVWTVEDTGSCESHGCHGHQTYTVKCTCGWTNVFENAYFGKPNEVEVMLEHRLSYLEQKLLQGV